MRSVICQAWEEHRIEATSLHGGGRNRDGGERAIWVSQLLIVEIEEQLVLEYGPAYRTAKVVVTLPRLGAGSVEVVSRIQVVILEIIVGGTVKPIGPAFTDEVENIAAAAVLRRGG